MKSFDTQTLRRFWHPVMPISVVAGAPQSIRLFGEDMVIWQDNAGAVSALQDRCSHQAVRLSLGGVRDDRLICSHHHWEFDGAGRCTRIPQRPDMLPPPCTRIRSYRAASRYGLAWVAVDDPLAPIPRIDEMDAPGFRIISVTSERWRVGALRLMASWLDVARLPCLPQGCDLPGEITVDAEIEESEFGLTRRVEFANGLRCTASWSAATCLKLHILHPTGLQQVVVVAAAPLTDRWSIVSRIHVRNDAATDVAESDLGRDDVVVAKAERNAFEAMEAGAPNPSGEFDTAQRVTRKLQAIIAARG